MEDPVDDVTRISVAQESSWEPRRRVDGRVEISVNYLHDNGRMTLASVTIEEYVRLWNEGALDFQQKEGKPRPAHNPTLEEIEAFLLANNRGKEEETKRWSPALDRALSEPAEPRKRRGEPDDEFEDDLLPEEADGEQNSSGEFGTEEAEDLETPEEEPAPGEDEMAQKEKGKYLQAIDLLAVTPKWAQMDLRKRVQALAEHMRRPAFVVGSFLRNNPDVERRLAEAAKQHAELPQRRPPQISLQESANTQGSPGVRAYMSRDAKLKILKEVADELKQAGRLAKTTLVEAALGDGEKRGPLFGKTTPKSLKVFVYGLQAEEQKMLGLS